MLVMDGRESLLKSDDEDELIFDHTSLLNKEISFRDLSKKLYQNGCKLQIARTINLCFSFFGLGLCFAIPTATLEDLKRSTGAGLDIRHIYTARYSGYLFGSLLGGFLFDRYNRQFLLFLSLLATSIGVIIMPFCSNVGSLMACTAITGITMGFLDTGGNVWCLDLWGRRSAPIMQTLHFCFGLGAFVAPLVAEPFLSPLYLNSSVGFEGNSTTGNATHRISHINFLHSGAPIKNLVQRGVEYGNLSFEMLAAPEYSKYRHFVFKRNATDNSSDVITFGNSSETQQSSSTENPDDLLNITSSTTAIPARTFKPKPQYADGNQLKEKDKWDRPSNKIQSILPNSSSTTTVTTSVAPLTTRHAELVSPRNDSEQNNSSNELMQDDKANANNTFDSGNQSDPQVSNNATGPFEGVTLVNSPPPNTTLPTANATTEERSQTENDIGTWPKVNTLPTTSKGTRSTVSVTPVLITTPPTGFQNGNISLKASPTVKVETTRSTPTNLENANIPLEVSPIQKVETTTQTQDHRTTPTSFENGSIPPKTTTQTQDQSNRTEVDKEITHSETVKKDITTVFSPSSKEVINSSAATVVRPPFSESLNFSTPIVSSTTSLDSSTMPSTTSVASPAISSTISAVSTAVSSTASAVSTTVSSTASAVSTMIKQTFPNDSAIHNNENKESVLVSESGHDPTGTKEEIPVTVHVSPSDASPTNTTDEQRVSGMEKPDRDLNISSNFGESQLPNSNNFQNLSETTFQSSSVNSPPVLNQSQSPLSDNKTPNKPATQSTHLEYSKETKPFDYLSTGPYQGKQTDLVTESDFEPGKNGLATSYEKSTPASSQITTLKTTTVIENVVHPNSESDPDESVTVNQYKFVTPSGTIAENEVYPAEVDHDTDTGKHHHKVGINRVKNSNVLTAQDGDNFTEPGSGNESKGPHLDVLTDLFDALRKNRLGKFEIAYVILGLYVLIVAIVFLVFLCKNPREPRSRQLEELNKMREPSQCFSYTMVCLLSLFLCLYVGIEVAVGEVLQTFASMETLRLSTASGYFLSYLFWGSFAISRFVTIIISMKFSGFCILLTNLTICLIASIMLVAGADKIEALLWLGTVILGLGVGPLFPTAIAWVERYVHVTNKTASVFILGAALGEIVIPIIINAFINQEPMVLMYVNIIVNALCFISFVILSVLAFRHGEKYLKKPKRSLYRLANMDDTEDGTELITNSFSNGNGTETGVKQRYRKLCT